MKKRRIFKLTSVILTLLLLVSCAPKNAGEISSTLPQSENQNIVSSETSKDEISSLPATSEKENVTSKKAETEGNNSRLLVDRPVSSQADISSSGLVGDVLYVMPENNPAPIFVHRKDAAIPTPLSYTDYAGGKEMGFGIKKLVVFSPRWDIEGVAIIKTYEELESIQSLEKIEKRPNDNKYDYYEDFFEEKALVMLLVNGQSHEYEIPQVLKNGNQMCIYYKTTHIPKVQIAGQYRTFIEISKEDLDSIKTLVVYAEKYNR